MNLSFREQKKLKIFLLVLILFMFLPILLAFFCGKIFYRNTTDSATRGLYLKTFSQELHYGDYVIVELPMDVPSLHVQQGFLLLKRVRGFSGDSYRIEEGRLSLGDADYPIYPVAGLPQQDDGIKFVPDGELLLLNDMEKSFDSRYFGPVSQGNVVAKVSLFLSYEPFYHIMEVLS